MRIISNQHFLAGEALFAKFVGLHALVEEERHALKAITGEGAWIGEGRAIVAEGETQPMVCVLLDGWACRCKDFRDGRRQILAFLTPGDIIGGGEAAPRQSDHAIRALTRVRVDWISQARWGAALVKHEGLAEAVFASELREAATLRAWLVNLGQRSGFERMAWLFCDLAKRLGGDVPCGVIAVPLSQQTLAFTLGLTPVHVNRLLQQLRVDGLVDFQGGILTIIDGI
jgi:CRP-like cAMP-binding protein